MGSVCEPGCGHVIDGWPTAEAGARPQTPERRGAGGDLTNMSTMSRERQRMWLAQRGKRRKGVEKNAVRSYVAEMANNTVAGDDNGRRRDPKGPVVFGQRAQLWRTR